MKVKRKERRQRTRTDLCLFAYFYMSESVPWEERYERGERNTEEQEEKERKKAGEEQEREDVLSPLSSFSVGLTCSSRLSSQ